MIKNYFQYCRQRNGKEHTGYAPYSAPYQHHDHSDQCIDLHPGSHDLGNDKMIVDKLYHDVHGKYQGGISKGIFGYEGDDHGQCCGHNAADIGNDIQYGACNTQDDGIINAQQ